MQFTKNVDLDTFKLPIGACRIAKKFAWLPTRFNYFVNHSVGHKQTTFWLETYYYLETYDKLNNRWERHYYLLSNGIVGRDTKPFSIEEYEDWVESGSPIFSFDDYYKLLDILDS